MTNTAVVAGGCFWGENAWEAFARPCQVVCDEGNKLTTRCTVPVRNKEFNFAIVW